jgi:hypothetical protein
MSPLRAESDIRDARVDSQKACAEEDVLRQEKIFSRRIPLFSGTRLILFSKSMRRKMPRSQVAAFMFSRSYNYPFFGSINAKYFAFFLGKVYLSISRAALILLAFLSPSRMGSLLDFEGWKI